VDASECGGNRQYIAALRHYTSSTLLAVQEAHDAGIQVSTAHHQERACRRMGESAAIALLPCWLT
jgi:hypothetical protein